MNRNRIRHKILKILVENYRYADEKYGDGQGFFLPQDEYRLAVSVTDIINLLKISYKDYEQSITKAIRDKSVKYDTTIETEDCLTIAENTFLYYNERTYLNQKNQWKEKYPFLYDVILILTASSVSVITTITISKFQNQKEQKEQDEINSRQDSVIRSIENSIKSVQIKDSIK